MDSVINVETSTTINKIANRLIILSIDNLLHNVPFQTYFVLTDCLIDYTLHVWQVCYNFSGWKQFS